MSNFFRKKTFPLCFSISKCLPTNTQSTPPHPFSDDQDHTNTTSSSSSFTAASTSLAVNNNTKNVFNSVYDFTPTTSSGDDFFFSSSSSSDDHRRDSESSQPTPPDFAAIFASRRFFFSSPGRSNSIFESTTTTITENTTTPDHENPSGVVAVAGDGAVEVSKYSMDPYVDFRRSMQEMIEARSVLTDGRTDLEYLHELLLCFLALNPKDTHKFIISAFTDIVVSLLSGPENGRRRREIKVRRQRNSLRRLSM